MWQIPSRIRARDGPIKFDWFKLYQHTVSLRDGKPSLFSLPLHACLQESHDMLSLCIKRDFLNILNRGRMQQQKPTHESRP